MNMNLHLNMRTRKVWRDIWQNKARTALVVASIAVGLMALSTTVRAQVIFQQNLLAELLATNQASATLITAPVSAEMITAVDRNAHITTAEGSQLIPARILLNGEWRTLRLLALPDLDDVQIDKIRPETGAWPPPERTLLIERSSLTALSAAGVGLGETVVVASPTGRERALPIAGTVYDLNVVSGRLLDQVVFGYISLDTAVWLGLLPQATTIKIKTSDTLGNRPSDIRPIAEEARNTIEAAGGQVFGVRIPQPNKHLLDNVIQSLLLILGTLGALSLVLSAFLVYNTISALLARQIPQIGVMKALGAPRTDILGMYVGMVLLFSLLAVITAVPLGMLGARIMTAQLGYLLNFDVQTYQVPPTIFLLELGLGVSIPLLATLLPILNGTRLTVQEALNTRGGGQFGAGRIDRLLTRLRRLPAAISYAARNIFRRKLRLALTLLTLSLGGAIFITVLSVRDSLFLTLDGIANYWQQDVTVDFQRPYRLAQVEEVLTAVEGVAASEGWLIWPAFYLRPDGQESDQPLSLFAVSPQSQFIEPTLLAGRWLQLGDSNALVANIDLTANETAVQVGETIRLRVNGQEADWQVVGLVTPQLVGAEEPRPENPIVYVSYDYFAAQDGRVGQINRLNVATTMGTAESQTAVASQINERLPERNILLRNVETYARTRALAENLTMPVLLLLGFMAFLFALVGGLSLTGTMSLNVLERTREIGIMRSLGATGADIRQTVIFEGVCVGVLSWVWAVVLAYPLGFVMSTAVGISFIKVPLIYQFAPLGILIWLVLVVVLSAIASYIPARKAARLVVREALAYE